MHDDPMSEDFRTILGPDYRDELSSDEQRRQLKAAVQFDTYAPDTVPDEVSATTYNPAVDGYCETGLSWGDSGWEPVDNTEALGQYPEYVPTDAAIELLVEYSPLLEVGAGRGYWAHVINENGGDCIPTDLHPEEDGPADHPATITHELPDGGLDGHAVWAEVQEFDAVDAIEAYPDRPVVMCHPSGSTRWTERVLNAIDDQPLIYIGEWFPGADAHPLFFKRLAETWSWADSFPVYDWASMHARGYVFEA